VNPDRGADNRSPGDRDSQPCTARMGWMLPARAKQENLKTWTVGYGGGCAPAAAAMYSLGRGESV
jgi:hypothetical protein